LKAARSTLPLTWFDATNCARGLEALREYKTEWDEVARTFKKTPKHDWSSHAADAFRYLSVAWREPIAEEDLKAQKITKWAADIAEMCKPKTFDQCIELFDAEHEDDDDHEPAALAFT
jgi:hypothetical protein